MSRNPAELLKSSDHRHLILKAPGVTQEIKLLLTLDVSTLNLNLSSVSRTGSLPFTCTLSWEGRGATDPESWAWSSEAEMQVVNMIWNQVRENWYMTSMVESSASTKYSTAPLVATCSGQTRSDKVRQGQTGWLEGSTVQEETSSRAENRSRHTSRIFRLNKRLIRLNKLLKMQIHAHKSSENL